MSPIPDKSSRGAHQRAYPPTARSSLWPQVEDERGAYQTESDAGREKRNQHSGGEACKNTQRPASRHTPCALGHKMPRVCVGEDFVFEEVVCDINAHE